MVFISISIEIMTEIILVRNLQTILVRLQLPIATSESCTSGLLASTLTCLPGASNVVAGGAVTYSALLKHRLLGVSLDILDVDKGGPGEVSEECAVAMARGILQTSGLLHKDYPELKADMMKDGSRGLALSTTGYLHGGPEGREGEVWIACAWTYHGREGGRTRQMWMQKEVPVDESDSDNQEAVRQKRKEYVVRESLKMATEVVEELEKSMD